MEIGIRLKEARESNNISLDHLQETTKIQKRYLLAIEQGNLHLLPGKFYARAFIKEYAMAVGLDPEELLMDYQEEPDSTEDINREMRYSRVQKNREASRTSKSPAILAIIPKIIVILLVIGIIFAGIYFYKKSMTDEKPNQVDQPSSDEVIINKGNQQESPKNQNSSNENNENNNEENEENEENDTNEEDEVENEPELALIETGSGSRPESTFELNNAGESVVLTFEPTGVSWLDVKNEKSESLLGINTAADTPSELDVSDETSVRINIGNTGELPVILINDIEIEYPTDSMTQSFWININKQTE